VAPYVGKLKIAWLFTSALPCVLLCGDQFVVEQVDLLFPNKHFYKIIKRVAIHVTCMDLLDQIFGKNVHKNSPQLWRLHPSTKIFQQKSFLLVIQALDIDF
jgi:hypothetical protein